MRLNRKTFIYTSLLLTLASCGLTSSSSSIKDAAHVPVDVSKSTFLYTMSKDLLTPMVKKDMSQEIKEEGWKNGSYFWTVGNLTASSNIELVESNTTISIDSLVVAKYVNAVTGKASKSGATATWWMDSNISTTSRMSTRISKEKGAHYLDTRTNFISRLTINKVTATAGGLFGGTKRRKAREAVYNNKNRMRNNMGKTASKEMNKELDIVAGDVVKTKEFSSLTSIGTSFTSVEGYGEKFSHSTTKESIRFALLMNKEGAPAVDEDADLAIRIHGETLTQFNQKKYGGKTFASKDLNGVLGPLLDSNKEDDSEESTGSITFADTNALVLEASNDELKITITGVKFTSEGDEYAYPMEIKATYKVEGKKLVRVGELKILPPGFKEGRDTMSRRQKLLIDELDYSFGKMLKPILVKESTTLSGKAAEAGVLNTTQLIAADGWFLMSAKLAK